MKIRDIFKAAETYNKIAALMESDTVEIRFVDSERNDGFPCWIGTDYKKFLRWAKAAYHPLTVKALNEADHKPHHWAAIERGEDGSEFGAVKFVFTNV